MFWKDSYIPVDKALLKLKSCSFLSKEILGLKNVQNRNVLDLSKLPDKQCFMSYYVKECGQEIAERLYKVYSRKIDYLDEFQHGKDIWKYGVGD